MAKNKPSKTQTERKEKMKTDKFTITVECDEKSFKVFIERDGVKKSWGGKDADVHDQAIIYAVGSTLQKLTATEAACYTSTFDEVIDDMFKGID